MRHALTIIPLVIFTNCPKCGERVNGHHSEVKIPLPMGMGRAYAILFPCPCGLTSAWLTTEFGLPLMDFRQVDFN